MESSTGDMKIKIVANNILSQTNRLELAQYVHTTLFSPTITSLIKTIKLGFLKTYPGLTE